MGRRPHVGQDQKIMQGHRRDEFFARLRRQRGSPHTREEVVGSESEVPVNQREEASQVGGQ